MILKKSHLHDSALKLMQKNKIEYKFMTKILTSVFLFCHTASINLQTFLKMHN